jgi:hypothetical protein
MNHDDLAAEIDNIFDPEPDDDQPHRELAHRRLSQVYGFDFKFMETWIWEGATSHPNTRLWPAGEPGGDELTRNMDVPDRLFMSALRVFADSILTYSARKKEPNRLRFYPPVILTFWSGFEAFVRHTSELMIHTSKDLPAPIAEYLRDEITTVNQKGVITQETRYRPVLDRYAVLLQYGFNYKIDRGNRHWQALQKAKDLRDYYTHIDAMNSRSISSDEVLEYLESAMLGIIWPSAEVQRTIMLGIHHLYYTWVQLVDLAREHLPNGYCEQPFFHAWHLTGEAYQFYCPFTNVDEEKFSNTKQEMAKWNKRSDPE